MNHFRPNSAEAQTVFDLSGGRCLDDDKLFTAFTITLKWNFQYSCLSVSKTEIGVYHYLQNCILTLFWNRFCAFAVCVDVTRQIIFNNTNIFLKGWHHPVSDNVTPSITIRKLNAHIYDFYFNTNFKYLRCLKESFKILTEISNKIRFFIYSYLQAFLN